MKNVLGTEFDHDLLVRNLAGEWLVQQPLELNGNPLFPAWVKPKFQ